MAHTMAHAMSHLTPIHHVSMRTWLCKECESNVHVLQTTQNKKTLLSWCTGQESFFSDDNDDTLSTLRLNSPTRGTNMYTTTRALLLFFPLTPSSTTFCHYYFFFDEALFPGVVCCHGNGELTKIKSGGVSCE